MEVESSLVDEQELVRGLTHRMNNILTVFHGYVGLMLDNKGLDAATRDGLTRIKAGARAATELMDRTHALVRRPAVICREVEVAETVRVLMPTILSLRKPTTQFVFDAPMKPCRAKVDSGRLRTAMIELLRNAFEAAATQPAGGEVRLRVSLEHGPAPEGVESDNADWVCVTVLDNGPGIPAAIEPKIFQPFFSMKRKPDAAGLGLTVAQGLIRECGGWLRHSSSPGKTRFEILVPAAPLPKEAAQPGAD